MEDRSDRIRLVVNADGFGAGESACRAVLRTHHEGIVTSTSVLGNCDDLPLVSKHLADAPKLGVGVQVVLSAGRAISPPGTAPSLVGTDGLLPASVAELALRWGRGQLAGADVEREIDLQVSRVRALGLTIDHLNAQGHAGFVPVVGRALESVARRYAIPGLRSTVETPNLAWVTEPSRGAALAALSGLAWLTRRGMGTLRHGPQSWGYAESERLDVVRIQEIVGRLGPGRHELICHPTEEPIPGDRRLRPRGELTALTSEAAREAVTRRGILLCRWSDLF